MKQLRIIRNFLFSILLVLMTLGEVVPTLAFSNNANINAVQYEFDEEEITERFVTPLIEVDYSDIYDDQASVAYNILTSTLTDPVGMQGFYGDYAIDDPNEVVEIIVQFVTPPAVALRLMQEKEIVASFSYTPSGDTASGASFEEQALSGHAAFEEQLNRVPVPFNIESPEIFAEHHSLFNGVYMRVPGSMVASIAGLPEVYAVFPNFSYTILEGESIDTQSTFFDNPNFMREVRNSLNIDYIHNELGITGAGVRVAILDTGIYHNHPEFARFLDERGRVPGWHHFDNSPSSDPAHTTSWHGTPVAGAAVAIAPNMEMWHYRVGLAGSGGGLSITRAIELAHADGMDVVNMSFGNSAGNPFDLRASMINLAVLDGVIFVGIAGNSGGIGWNTLHNPGALPLVITAGNARVDGSGVTASSSRGPVGGTYHIKPDITAPGFVFAPSVGGGYGHYYGTSLASPVIAGVAALLREANPDATPQEIRAMMMNTARPLTNMNPNHVFEVGAGFLQPLEALRSQDLVTVEHYIPNGSNSNAPWVLETMASLSFGNANRLLTNSLNAYTITSTIRNNHNTVRTYTIDYYFTNNPNSGTMLSFDRQSITIPPNQTGTFATTISLTQGFFPEGFYEGYIYVRAGEDIVARLPFGLVNTTDITFVPHIVIFELTGSGGQIADIERVVNQGHTIGLANVPTRGHDNGIYVITGWRENGVGPVLTQQEVGDFEVRGSTRFVAVWGPITEWEHLRVHISGLSAGAHTIQILHDITASTVSGLIGTAISIPVGVNVTLESDNTSRRTLTQTNSGQRHFIIGNSASLILNNNITLNGGVVNNTNNAGGIQVNAGGTLTMEDGSIIENCRRTVYGGAVALSGSGSGELTQALFAMNGGVIRNNSATNGGGVHLWENGHMIMIAGTIEGNNSTASGSLVVGGGGVAVRDDLSTFTMSGGTIRRNEAFSGGGVFANGNAYFEMSGTAIITDNIARGNAGNLGGGGVSLHNSTFNMTGGTISDNRNPRGAGVFIGGATGTSHMTMSGGTITDNTASLLGGGVSVGASSARGTFAMSGGTISGNTASTGGGIHVGPDSALIVDNENVLIEENQASHGGGIGQSGGTVTITGGTIRRNTATIQGGGVRIGTSGEDAFTMTGGTISHNHTNGDGGGLFTTQHTYQSPLPTGMNYTNVTIGTNANFSHNTADNGAFMPPSNAATETRISVTTTRSGAFAHVLNNLDINFRPEGQSPIPLRLVRFLDGDTLVDSVEIHEDGQIVAGNIPLLSRDGYNFMGWSRTPDGEVESLTGLTITAAIDFYAVWQEARVCQVVASGQFEDGAGIEGAKWELCEDGTLMVAEGFINWVAPATTFESPWHAYREDINRIVFTGSVTAGPSLQFLFSILTNVTEIKGLTYFDTSQVTDMSWMFAGLNQLRRLDLTNFDTSQVTDMTWMFIATNALRELTLGENFVFGADANLPAIPRTDEFTGVWQNVGSGTVENPNGNHALTSAGLMTRFNGSTMADTWVWRPAPSVVASCGPDHSVIAEGQFPGAAGARWELCSDFTMLVGEGVISSAGFGLSPWRIISGVNTINQTSPITRIVFTGPVQGESALVVGGSSLNRGSIESLFVGLPNLREIEGLTYFETTGVRSMATMFHGLRNLGMSTLDLSNFDTSHVTTMFGMFWGIDNLESLDLSHFNTSNVTNMVRMFENLRSLTYLDISNFDTSNVTNMANMFSGASSLERLDISSFNTSRVTNMTDMFSRTTSLRELVLGEQFRFIGNPGLPAVPITAEFTGYWQNVGNGTVDNPSGEFVFTSAELMAQYYGPEMADTWVWQPAR